MAKSAREAALTILERCRRKQAFSDALLGSVIKTAGLNQKDSALCARLSYGVLQNSLLCDFYIDSYLSGAQKLEPKVRDILQLSVYQILFLDKIPSHAAVSEGVELCKKLGFARASGLVNAVLRKISSNKDKLPEIPKTDFTEYLSIKYSSPKALAARILKDFDPEFTEAFLAVSNEPAPLTIQVNTLKTSGDELQARLTALGISCTPHAILSDCYELSGTGDIAALDEHRQGLFYVQDAAARLSVLAAGAKAGMCVLDACAAPGGKSFAAAIAMENQGKIFACDIHENKLVRVNEGANALGISIITTAEMDASKPGSDLFNSFDLVLADVPCSGLGVIRKKPDIRYKNMKELEGLPKTQLGILEGLAPCVKSGGVLLYSTCTVLDCENRGVVSSFLEAHPEFECEAFQLPLPLGQAADGCLSLYPQIHATDGFFICKMRKRP